MAKIVNIPLPIEAYDDGSRYADQYEFCPCLSCVVNKIGLPVIKADRFRLAFYESAVKTGLDAVNRIDPANCPYCTNNIQFYRSDAFRE